MKALPVPPLEQTLAGYRDALRVLSGDDQQAATDAAIDAYRHGGGPADQQALQQFAAETEKAGSNWMAEAWLAGYLGSRGPITLTSNVGLQLNWPPDTRGLDRAADLIHRFAHVHLAWLRGELEPETTPRGEPVDGGQRRFLAGGLRHPRAGCDTYLFGPDAAADREIVVFWRGAPAVLPISDADGRPFGVAALAEALRDLTADPGRQPSDFTDLSYVGSERGAALLDRLLADPDNAATYDRLARTLFAVNLTHGTDDADGYLRRVAFERGRTWVYKPVTYDIDLAGDLAAVHLEHTLVDGATLKGVVRLAQQVVPEDTTAAPGAWQPLTWSLSAALARDVRQAADDYAEQAADYRVRTVVFPLPIPAELPFRLSLDAAQQWVMLYAQLACYQHLRSTYEAVDMREYRAGRTECLRPNTDAAVTLARALLDGTASPDQLFAALEAHKQWVKACKSGNGIDRHLFGLRLMAQRRDGSTALWDEPGYARLTTDFLSTTSLGDPHQLIRFAFAPTSVGGLGLSYSAEAGSLEFCISYRASEHDADIDAFTDALRRGTDALGALVTRAAQA